jgi:hypothetical protein
VRAKSNKAQFHHFLPMKKSGDEAETLGFRLLAAVLSIPIFELSLFLGFHAATGSRRSSYLFFSLPLWLHAVYMTGAVGVGFVFGFQGITWLLGHLFLTHFPNERSIKMTALLWLAILGLSLLGFLSTGRL